MYLKQVVHLYHFKDNGEDDSQREGTFTVPMVNKNTLLQSLSPSLFLSPFKSNIQKKGHNKALLSFLCLFYATPSHCKSEKYSSPLSCLNMSVTDSLLVLEYIIRIFNSYIYSILGLYSSQESEDAAQRDEQIPEPQTVSLVRNKCKMCSLSMALFSLKSS